VSTPGFSAPVVGFLPVRLTLDVRDLLVASWPVDRAAVARVLPAGLEPVEVEGRHLVSLAALCYAGGRLGRLPVPAFSQLNVRAYVAWENEPAVFFLATRVTPLGMGGAFLGAPYRPARLRFRRGFAEAPGLGVSLRYAVEGPATPGPLGGHELGLFEAAGLRLVRIQRGEAGWQRAALTTEARAEPLAALGFELRGEPSLFYAERTEFALELPARKISASLPDR
jgi:hypothetical protein